MGSPTGTTLSAGATGPDRKPSRNTSTSMTALSVSTVATTSPRATLSPGCFSQLTITPSVMVSESWGILMVYVASGGAAPDPCAWGAGTSSGAGSGEDSLGLTRRRLGLLRLGRRGGRRLPLLHHLLGGGDQVGDGVAHGHHAVNGGQRPRQIALAEHLHVHDRLVGLDRGHDIAPLESCPRGSSPN